MAVTKAQLRARIEAILGGIDGLTVLTGAEKKLSDVSVPACEVRRPAVRRKRIAAGQYQLTLRYPVWVIVDTLPDLMDYATLDTVYDACELWEETISAVFEGLPRLEHNDAGLAFGVGDLESSEPGYMPFKSEQVGGFSITLPVIVIRSR